MLLKEEGKGKKNKFKPIIPSNKKDKLKLEGQIEPKKEPKVLLPSGKQGDKNKTPIAKPILDSDVINKIPKGGKVKEPKTPKVTLPKKEGGKTKDMTIPKDVKPPIKKPDQGRVPQNKDKGAKVIDTNPSDKSGKNKERGTIVIPPQPTKKPIDKSDIRKPDQSPKRNQDDDGGRSSSLPNSPYVKIIQKSV